jgi:hypothetical protein
MILRFAPFDIALVVALAGVVADLVVTRWRYWAALAYLC